MKLNIWITMFILLSVLAVAQPIFEQTTLLGTELLEVESTALLKYTLGNDLQFNFHVYNSTGLVLDNTSTACKFHLFDLNGFHIMELFLSYDLSDSDFFINISSSNFATVGTYAFLVNCNTSTNGGFHSSQFKIIYETVIPKEIYTGLFLFMAFNSLLFAFIGFNLKEEKPSKEQFRLPYLRIFFLSMSIFNVLITVVLILFSSNADLSSALEGYLYYIGFIFALYLYGILEAIFFAKKRWDSIEGDR